MLLVLKVRPVLLVRLVLQARKVRLGQRALKVRLARLVRLGQRALKVRRARKA